MNRRRQPFPQPAAAVELASRAVLPGLDAEAAARRLRAAEALYRSAWGLKLAWLRRCHPDLPEAQLRRMVREIFLHASG
jgi:hypothetical protein